MPLFQKANEPETPRHGEKVSIEDRKKEAEHVLQKYNNQRIPVIVERAKSAQSMPLIDKKKYLVPEDMTYAQFLHVIRKRIRLSPEETIFLFINNVQPPSGQTLGSLYSEHKEADGFLRAVYSNENAFGELVKLMLLQSIFGNIV